MQVSNFRVDIFYRLYLWGSGSEWGGDYRTGPALHQTGSQRRGISGPQNAGTGNGNPGQGSDTMQTMTLILKWLMGFYTKKLHWLLTV